VGLTQPFAGAVADRIGTGRVIFTGPLLVALGTFHDALHDHDRRADPGQPPIREARPARAAVAMP
jgi:hypothetical protein